MGHGQPGGYVGISGDDDFITQPYAKGHECKMQSYRPVANRCGVSNSGIFSKFFLELSYETTL